MTDTGASLPVDIGRGTLVSLRQDSLPQPIQTRNAPVLASVATSYKDQLSSWPQGGGVPTSVMAPQRRQTLAGSLQIRSDLASDEESGLSSSESRNSRSRHVKNRPLGVSSSSCSPSAMLRHC